MRSSYLFALGVMILSFTATIESRSSADEKLRELLKELKLLENVKQRTADENIRIPPGAHEIPDDDDNDDDNNNAKDPENNDNGKHVNSDIDHEIEIIAASLRDNNNDDNGDHNDDDVDDNGDHTDGDVDDHTESVHLPPGAHEIPSEDCKTGEDCKKPINDKNNSVDVNEAILMKYSELKKQRHVDKMVDETEIEKYVLPNYKPCGADQPEVISDESGSILSPGFSNNTYPNKLICSWKFTARAPKVVRITISIIAIERSNLCQYDSLQIWNVVGSTSTMIGKYCGSTQPQELLQSSEQTLVVFFVTDGAINTGRFSFQFDVVDPNPPEPSLSSCGTPYIQPDVSQKIVNGRPAIPNSWPWQISLRLLINGKQYHICGGSIVTANVVLTAAHCCFDENHIAFDKTQFMVVAGDYDQKTSKDGPIQSSRVKNLYTHMSYNPKTASSANDIAAMVLETPFTLQKNVLPVCLPTQNPSLTSLCYATGWGKTQGTGDETILNQVRLPVVSQTVCSQTDHNGAGIIDSKLCAGYEEGGKDACQGDSGGPYVCKNAINGRWYLQGITSYGEGCAAWKKPGVYTRVNYFLGWIFQTTRVVA